MPTLRVILRRLRRLVMATLYLLLPSALLSLALYLVHDGFPAVPALGLFACFGLLLSITLLGGAWRSEL